jgi:peptide/nickel transport system permease protein
MGYALRRLIHSLLVLLSLTVVTFILLNLAGDPAVLLSSPDASLTDIEQLRHTLGFDQPLPVQYLEWLGRAAQGDFGYSYRQGQGALPLVLERLPATLELIGASLLVSLAIAGPAGILAALRRGSRLDRAIIAFTVFTQSMPTFWLGIVMILLFAVTLHWLPASGGGNISHLIMPALALGAFQVGTFARVLRSSMLEVLDADFVRTARAKGLPERRVILVHALGNATLPVITLLGLQVGALYGGTIVTETVFGWPGVNSLAITSISNHDIPVVQAFVIVVGVLVLATNLAVELLYGQIDPRTRRPV